MRIRLLERVDNGVEANIKVTIRGLHKRFVLRNKTREVTRKHKHCGGASRFCSWFAWLVWDADRTYNSQGWFAMSSEVGSIFVRNSGTKDHLLEIPLGSRLRKTKGLVSQLCIRRRSIRYLSLLLSSVDYVIRVAIFCASPSWVVCTKNSDGFGLAWIVVIPKCRGYGRFFVKLC